MRLKTKPFRFYNSRWWAKIFRLPSFFFEGSFENSNYTPNASTQRQGPDCCGGTEPGDDYVENPEKTNGGTLVIAYQCNPSIAGQEFLFAKSRYAVITGRERKDNDVIAYHLRQSFKPGESTPELANKIGYDLAMSLTKGNHAFIVCTHVDKQHIHSHIVFNSTTLDGTRKF